MITHPSCGKSWTGSSRAHCAACCETFIGNTAADKHRTGSFGIDRRCLPPAEAGLIAISHPWGICWHIPQGCDRTPAAAAAYAT